MPAEPQCLLKYNISTDKATVGSDDAVNTIKATVSSDATLTITGELVNRSADLDFDRLTSINVYFSAGMARRAE